MTLAAAQRTLRPGRRALEFARWAVSEFGRPGTRPDTVVVDRTQKALTAAYGRGEGTVAWYMSQLRTAGIVPSSRPLVIDVESLEHPTETPAPP